MVQADVGDVGDPDLVRTLDCQVFDEVGVAWEGVAAVGGPRRADRRDAGQAQFVHPAPHPLAVHRPAETPHHSGQASVAVGRPLGGQIEQGRLEHGLVEGGPRHVVDGAAWHAEQPADETDRVVVGERHDDLPFLVAGPLAAATPFLGSPVRRPGGRRVVRVRQCGRARRRWSPSASKTVGNRSRTAAFQLARRLGLRLCLRQSSAWLASPLRSCKTTWALNSAEKDRRIRGMTMTPGMAQ